MVTLFNETTSMVEGVVYSMIVLIDDVGAVAVVNDTD